VLPTQSHQPSSNHSAQQEILHRAHCAHQNAERIFTPPNNPDKMPRVAGASSSYTPNAPSSPPKPRNTGSAGLLARQLKQMQSAKDIPGISCGLIDDSDVFQWEVMLMISDDCRYYGGKAPTYLFWTSLYKHKVLARGGQLESRL
jgi:hypothetical protein